MSNPNQVVPSVVGNNYVSSKPTVLHTVKKCCNYIWTGDFLVRDGDKNVVYRGHKSGFIKKKIALTNEIDGTVITLRRIPLGNMKWKAYSGVGDENLLFESKAHCRTTKVYLPTNIERNQPDFTFKRVTWISRKYKVFYGQELIAETTKEGCKFGRRKNFMSVVENIDQAFMAAILSLLEYQSECDKRY